jgi:Protein of unknown function (DUF1499)
MIVAIISSRLFLPIPRRRSSPGWRTSWRSGAILPSSPRRPGYLRVEFHTTLFVDDGEFLFDKGHFVIPVRSASRLGYFDLGKNRSRIE